MIERHFFVKDIAFFVTSRRMTWWHGIKKERWMLHLFLKEVRWTCTHIVKDS